MMNIAPGALVTLMHASGEQIPIRDASNVATFFWVFHGTRAIVTSTSDCLLHPSYKHLTHLERHEVIACDGSLGHGWVDDVYIKEIP